MNSLLQSKMIRQLIQVIGFSIFVFSSGVSSAAITDLASGPLVTATTGEVLPNVMYVLDNSGSMGWDFMPDYVGYNSQASASQRLAKYNNKCKASNGVFSAFCGYTDPAFMSSVFNSIYYDPETRYLPPVNSDGSSKISMTNANTAGWTQVPNDAYGVQANVNNSLVPTASGDGYLDTVWCNTNSPTAANLIDPAVCKQNDQYTWPSPTYSSAFNIRTNPYYYNVKAGEYCTTKDLTTCTSATAPTGIYTFPAKLRWCTDATLTNCQAKYLETTPSYTFARWAGYKTTDDAIITLSPDIANSPTASSVALSVTNITANGTRIIPTTPSPALTITDTASFTQRVALATNIAAAINAFVPSTGQDFTATTDDDVVIVTPVGTTTYAGTLAMTTTTNVVTGINQVQAVGTLKITKAKATSSVNTIKVGTGAVDILGGVPINVIGTNDTATTRRKLADDIVTRINAYVSSPDYTAVSDNLTQPTITITAVTGGTSGNGTMAVATTGASNIGVTATNLAGGGPVTVTKTYTIPYKISQFTGGVPTVTTFNRVDIEPFTPFYPKATTRTDCVTNSTACTYDEEMTNFANWYSYYRTRMQMMKSSTSLAFKSIDSRFRVGFITIANQSSNYLPIAQYTQTQKDSWYTQLFSTDPATSTPLRSALTTVGRIFAGQGGSMGLNNADPMQYSCQQNFTILTTDGYWNTDSNAAVKDLAGQPVGNRDGGTTPRPMFEGATASSNTLADAAKYYYDTDLRTSTLGNCTGSTRANGTTGDVCANNVFVTPTDNNIQQHMTTFTLGLGVDATISYSADYKTASSGDYYEITQGTRNWPVPVADSQTAVDDLWHAAVNGQGTYFSAKNPTQLSSSLSNALQSIKSKVGAGAAAATSTLNPVALDNFSYVASYTSVKWIGNLEARTINTDTGEVSEQAQWCLEDLVADTCASPGSVVHVAGNSTNGNTDQYFCRTSSATASTCLAPGILNGTNCDVEMNTSCNGTLKSKVVSLLDTAAQAAGTPQDTRDIYMNVNGTLGSFSAANLVAAGKSAFFDNTFQSTNLTQWSGLSSTQRALATTSNLVMFLRGNSMWEDRASNFNSSTGVDNRIYRNRDAVLGDLIDSTPIFVGSPKANFSDPGYGTSATIGSYKQIQSSRAGTVFIGGNDGMLHAIDSSNGDERWAYVPTMVMDNMWKLADFGYGGSSSTLSHSFYVDGDIIANDICTANCTSASNAVWKTILVGGLNGGGKGYFALDVTNPDTPQLLWEFDTSDDNDLGFTYGNPIITKKADGTWVVLVTSGHNNLTGSNPGTGFLYVLNAANGSVISKYSTGVGDSSTPSGLSKINGFVADALTNNQVSYVYGGDLLGNVWRFDINSAQSSNNPYKFAVLKDPSGNTQPITTRPELVNINGKIMVYVGTGRYLGVNDLTDTQQQTIYAITDDITTTSGTMVNPRANSTMVSQSLVTNATTATRSVQTPQNSVNLTTGRGWYIDLPESGERQNIPAQLVFGTLLLPTTVPENSLCSPGGHGWLNFLDYRTGGAVSSNVVSTRTNAPIVGINVLYVKGKPVVNVVTADNPTPEKPPVQPPFTGGNQSGFTNHRVIWRELLNEQQ